MHFISEVCILNVLNAQREHIVAAFCDIPFFDGCLYVRRAYMEPMATLCSLAPSVQRWRLGEWETRQFKFRDHKLSWGWGREGFVLGGCGAGSNCVVLLMLSVLHKDLLCKPGLWGLNGLAQGYPEFKWQSQETALAPEPASFLYTLLSFQNHLMVWTALWLSLGAVYTLCWELTWGWGHRAHCALLFKVS